MFVHTSIVLYVYCMWSCFMVINKIIRIRSAFSFYPVFLSYLLILILLWIFYLRIALSLIDRDVYCITVYTNNLINIWHHILLWLSIVNDFPLEHQLYALRSSWIQIPRWLHIILCLVILFHLMKVSYLLIYRY